jgi:hypothetical protein
LFSVTAHCLTAHFTSLWGFPELPYEGFIQAAVFRCIQCETGSSAWHLTAQAEANSLGLLTVVVTDMTSFSSLMPAAQPNMSKISVCASQVWHLGARPLKLLREITAAYRQNY